MKITTFKAFRSRNYRLFFFGQSASLIGTWMQRTALYWVIYVQTNSSFMLGLTVFATQFPSFIFSLLGGIVADRYNRYRVLLITQVASMIQAIVLAILVLINHYTVLELLLLSVLLGIINAFDVPARQSLVHDMIDDQEDLPNAIALNSSMVNMALLVGPAISGIVLGKWGAGVCFLINAGSFVAVILSLLLMKLPKHVPVVRTLKMTGELKEGFQYLKNTSSIRSVVLMLASTSLLVLPFSTLLPVYAKVILSGNATTFGYLNSFIGLGAVGGALFLASLSSSRNLKKILLAGSFIFGLGLILFSHTTNFTLAFCFATLAGFGMMSQTTVSNTILQTSVAPSMRGRVMSYFAMAFFGMLPLGSLLIGKVAEYIGASNTILAQGIIAILITIVFSIPKKDKTQRKK